MSVQHRSRGKAFRDNAQGAESLWHQIMQGGPLTMATKLIELGDGTLVEVEVQADEARPISGGAAEKVLDATLARITPMMLKVSRPILEAWEQMNQEMDIESAQVELGFSFESEGNLYLAKASASANFTVTFSLKPKRNTT